MLRRREMMQQETDTPRLLWKLEQPTSAGEKVNTGIHPYAKGDHSWTVLFQCTLPKGFTYGWNLGGWANGATFLYHRSGYYLQLIYSMKLSASASGSKTVGQISGNTFTERKMAVSYNAENHQFAFWSASNNKSTVIMDSEYTGYHNDCVAKNPSFWINNATQSISFQQFEIYNYVLPDSEIEAFF